MLDWHFIYSLPSLYRRMTIRRILAVILIIPYSIDPLPDEITTQADIPL
jgi:hypothetical protein